MGQWVRIGSVREMPTERHAKAFDAAGNRVCVACIHGHLAALQDECPHHGAQLSEGAIENGRIVCAWHGWSFDPKTGQELRNPLGHARVYPLRVEGEDVLCEV
jgi:nitrite reductase (NADH) small subunit